jgi:general secretion pathway protein N
MRIRLFLLALLLAFAASSTPASTVAAQTPARGAPADGAEPPPTPGETVDEGAADTDTGKDQPTDEAAPADDGERAPTEKSGGDATSPPPIAGSAPAVDGMGGSRRPTSATPSPFAPGGEDARPQPAPSSAPRPPTPGAGATVAPPVIQGGLGIPALTNLRQTRDRPLFVPARRGVQPAPAAPVLAPPPAPEPVEEPPAPLTLTLSGVVTGPDVAMAILLDPTDSKTKHMRVGDEHDGWRLERIDRIAVTFSRDGEEAVLALKPPGVSTSEPGGRRPRASGRPPERVDAEDN